MASIVSARDQIEQEASGEAVLELVAVRYVGNRTSYDVSAHLHAQGWPGMAPLDGGPEPRSKGAWALAVVPDRTLDAIEGRPDLEIVYAADQREAFARILLEEGIPENAVGQGAERDLQDRLFEALDLEPVSHGGPFEDQLSAIAYPEGDAPEPDPAEVDDETRGVVAEFLEYNRNQLGDICKVLREDPSEFNLTQNAKKTERAEFIASFDASERAAAVDAALGGGDDE